MTSPTLNRTDPLTGLEPHDVIDQWAAREFDELSDGELTELAAAHLAVPRRDPADSFVLHAPLELMARSGLLRLVAPEDRRHARQRIAWLAATYDTYEPIPRSTPRSTAQQGAAPPVERLRAAITAGDLEEIDRAAVELVATTTAGELVRHLGDLIVDRLSAAGHGSIFLYQLPRLLAADAAAARMARGLLQEVGRQPTWTLSWMDHREPGLRPTRDLRARLLETPHAGDPGSHFIHPTMSLVERSGLAADLLAAPTLGLPVDEARRDLLRVAAWSMLQDDPAHAPYGWSHALTMPQATLGIAGHGADPARAVAVAATFVLGFRATLGTVTLDPRRVPTRRDDLDPDTFLDAGPAAAASAVWHAPDAQLGRYVRRLVSYAAVHSDAHLAKYTLACLDATRDDPDAGRLYLAAAAFLGGWWRTRGEDDDLFSPGS